MRMSRKLPVAMLYAIAALCMTRATFAADLALLSNGFTIRHDHHVILGDKTRLFFSSDDSSFTDVATADISSYEPDLTPPAPLGSQPALPSASAGPHTTADLNQVVSSASAAYHLDPDLVNSVIHAESGFNVRAVSPKGAQGLMQLMPSTANELGVNNAFDPQENVGGGSHYLRELLERYNFDLIKALAAYNAGPERVEQYNGVPPFQETRAYVARIVRDYNQKKIAQERAAAATQKQAKTRSATTASTRSAHAPSTAKPTGKSTGQPTTKITSQVTSSPGPPDSPR
jgi:soluble lytic murein transglycosylase-like protein